MMSECPSHPTKFSLNPSLLIFLPPHDSPPTQPLIPGPILLIDMISPFICRSISCAKGDGGSAV